MWPFLSYGQCPVPSCPDKGSLSVLVFSNYRKKRKEATQKEMMKTLQTSGSTPIKRCIELASEKGASS